MSVGRRKSVKTGLEIQCREHTAVVFRGTLCKGHCDHLTQYTQLRTQDLKFSAGNIASTNTVFQLIFLQVHREPLNNCDHLARISFKIIETIR